ncbi:MAG: DUF2339 domain-containing protein [Chitinophagaceae bacterium]
MEVLSVLLFIVILLLILSLKGNVNSRLEKVEAEIFRLRQQLFKATEEKVTVAREKQIITPVIPVSPTATIPKIEEPEIKDTEKRPLSEELTSLLQQSEEQEEKIILQQEVVLEATGPSDAVASVGERTTVSGQQPLSGASQQAARTHKPSFMELNPDMEKFIGENLVSKIGIVILVLAIGYFVKFAIDKDWIGPVGRVGIGILCGAILVGVAHVLRKSYKAFSSVLAGGGLAVFYFTITLGFHQFHLFSQTIAFIIMVVITGFAVALSILYDRQEVAIIALIGGFATPFMVSTGSGNYKILFSYLIILNTGLLIIAYYKAWRLLNLLAFIFTVLLFGSWLITLEYKPAPGTYRNGFLFATLFYLLFFIINIAHNIREKKKFIASDFGILLANTCLYFGAGLYLLKMMEADAYLGLFTAGIGIFNLASSYILLRKRKIDNNILYLLIGITLSFISLTAPIQLNGNNITLFWASEAVLLFWLYQKSQIRIIRFGSLLVWIAMLISLLMDWVNVYGIGSNKVSIIVNKGFITSIFAAIASYLLFLLRKKETKEISTHSGIRIPYNVFRIAGIVLLFAAGAFEINHQFQYYYAGFNLQVLYLLLYTFAYVCLFILITDKIPSLPLNFYIKTALLAVCIFVYLISLPDVFAVQRNLLEQQRLIRHFTAHWLEALLIAFIVYKLIALLRSSQSTIKSNMNLLTWIICIVVVIYLSSEIHLLVNNLFYDKNGSLAEIQRVYIKTGLPVLWGLCSFGFMWFGMRHKYRSLRIISLTLFSITLIKLFFFDIRNIPVAGKIAAFFSLGILLLVISFMYQRLKKIIIEDEKKPSA